MGEEHLDFLAQMSRLFEGRRAGEGSSRRIRKAFPYYEKSANSHARDAGALRELSNPSRADKREFFEQSLHLSQIVVCGAADPRPRRRPCACYSGACFSAIAHKL